MSSIGSSRSTFRRKIEPLKGPPVSGSRAGRPGTLVDRSRAVSGRPVRFDLRLEQRDESGRHERADVEAFLDLSRVDEDRRLVTGDQVVDAILERLEDVQRVGTVAEQPL
jgi:hypothetical protein